MTELSQEQEAIEVEYVDELPMVNLTDKFLVAKKARDNFAKDQVEFFPYCLKTYLLPRILEKAKSNSNRILLFSTDPSGRERLFVSRKNFSDDHLGDIENQRSIAKEYFENLQDVKSLCDILTSKGQNKLGVSIYHNAFTVTSYEEMFHAVIDNPTEKRHKTTTKLLAIYLHNKGCYLWPLRSFRNEKVSKVYIFGSKIKLTSYAEDLLKVFERKMPERELRHLPRVLRITKWSSIDDLHDEDVKQLRILLASKFLANNLAIGNKSSEHGKSRYGNHLQNAFSIFCKTAIDLGAKISYMSSHDVRSININTGRGDGTFRWLDKYGSRFTYWKTELIEYVAAEEKKGRQSLRGLCVMELNPIIDYFLFLNSKGIDISSAVEISRENHIEYRKSSHPDIPSFTEWLETSNKGLNRQNNAIHGARRFIQFIIDRKNLRIRNPILEIDAPKQRHAQKSYRTALSVSWWKGLIEMMHQNPPTYKEKIVVDNGLVERDSPSLQTYMLLRLYYGFRHFQATYLDKNTVLRNSDLLEISGDKNPNREILQTVPIFDPRIKGKIQECIVWQDTYNKPAEPVHYNKNKNSPYGKVHPLLRPIGYDKNPFGKKTCEVYVKRCLLKYQKISNLPATEHIILDPDGKPFDMATIDPDTMKYTLTERCVTEFDLHTLRVTAASIWADLDVPWEVIADFLTGHASLAMLRIYIKSQRAGERIKEAWAKVDDRLEVERAVKEDADSAIAKYRLMSRKYSDTPDIDGIEALRTTSRVHWRFLGRGVCPTGACLPGKADRCFVCPLYVTGPKYKNAVAAYTNLIRERIYILLAETTTSRMNPEERRAELELDFQEFFAGSSWFKLLEEKEKGAEGSSSKVVLYSQTEYKFENLTPIMAAIQRSIDIKLVPETYSENAKYVIREMIERFFAKTSHADKLQSRLIGCNNGLEYVQNTADFFIDLMSKGATDEDLEIMFSDSSASITANMSTFLGIEGMGTEVANG